MSKKNPLKFVETSDQYYIQSVDSPQSLSLTDSNGKDILTITDKGQVIWHQTDKADEASEILTSAIVMTVEKKAGIKQSREEWEARITEALASVAEKEPITAETLTDVIGKCIMIDRLSGLK